MGKTKSSLELPSFSPAPKKYSSQSTSDRSRKNSLFSSSSEIVPQSLIANNEETSNPLVNTAMMGRLGKTRNRSDTSTTMLSNVGFQSIGFHRGSDDKSSASFDNTRGTRNPGALNSGNENSRSNLYTPSTNISVRKNNDNRTSAFLTPINSQRKSMSSSRISLQRSRSENSDYGLDFDRSSCASVNSTDNQAKGRKKHFYSNFFSKHSSSNKNSQKLQSNNDDTSSHSISKILHYPHYSNRYHNGRTSLSSSANSIFEGSTSKRQISNHVLQDLITQQETLTKNDLSYLNDLIKNLPSLEVNFIHFSHDERERILQNTWHVYCNVCFALFKNHRIWNLHNKIEDLNRILRFYIKLIQYNINKSMPSSTSLSPYQTGSSSTVVDSRADSFPLEGSRVATSNKFSKSSTAIPTLTPTAKEAASLFSDNLEDFFFSALYVLENQIVFNYKDESVINNAIRRLCIIWKTFYENIYHDVLILNIPFDTFFNESYNNVVDPSKVPGGKSGNSIVSVENIVLKCFRDSIILPYYQNFSHANEGGSTSFMKYLNGQEDIAPKEKLLLLQCLGIIKTINSNDENQNIIDELSEGLRLSMS